MSDYVYAKAEELIDALQLLANVDDLKNIKAVIASVVEDCAREAENAATCRQHSYCCEREDRAADRIRSLLSPDMKGQP